MNGDGTNPAEKYELPFGKQPIDDIPFDDGFDDDPRDRWDADDERRRNDCFAPPKDPIECYCLHCQRTFTSDQIWFQRIVGRADGELDGFWMCPTNNCSGAGFTFDIFPTDPDHPANAGWFDDDDDDEGDYDPQQDEDIEAFNPDDVGDGNPATADYDPAESKYKRLDDDLGDADNDIGEGDEWKLGLAPGEQVPAADVLVGKRAQRMGSRAGGLRCAGSSAPRAELDQARQRRPAVQRGRYSVLAVVPKRPRHRVRLQGL